LDKKKRQNKKRGQNTENLKGTWEKLRGAGEQKDKVFRTARGGRRARAGEGYWGGKRSRLPTCSATGGGESSGMSGEEQ